MAVEGAICRHMAWYSGRAGGLNGRLAGYQYGAMELKAAWQIALEKHEKYERLTPVTEELLDLVQMLEESWDSITPSERPEPERQRIAA